MLKTLSHGKMQAYSIRHKSINKRCTSWLELITYAHIDKKRQNIMIKYQIKDIFPLFLLAIQHEKYHFLTDFPKTLQSFIVISF